MLMSRPLLFGVVWSFVSASAQDTPPTESEPPPAIEIDTADIEGQPQQDLVKVTNARYYVWHDGNGWHLRTAAKGLTQFNGSLKLQGGSFGKLRTIGLETKARDRWELNADRTVIRFQIHTGGSFDGFDFDVRRDRDDASIAFDLTHGKDKIRRPRRIFLGRNSKNPQGTHFTCPAAPELVKQ